MSNVYSEAIAEAYASVPETAIVFSTLEILNPAFIDDDGNPTSVRVVRDYANLSARLEASAPLNPGQVVEFIACAFEITLPGFEDGQMPQLQITIDNVDRVITQRLMQAIGQSSEIRIIYRPYLASDPLNGPEMDPVISMVLTEVEVDAMQITGTASLDDLQNLNFPSKTYTTERFPGLLR
ncbi:DUF1833 family protein [Chitinasiproducens palmae]|uniref:Uncharacterized protein n=1 Tax=Chitinasiproducens palmae TaxID=1770053 RepID=A0A1H2PT63_9BURK|nr:DUF1833 family protein [Chitinasiproducens palmae]SDV49828.1 protein of unknown function [Chitinasiproducens palmae]